MLDVSWLFLGQAQATTGNMAVVSFMIYLAAVFALACLSSMQRSEGGFVSEYFLGNRNLGVWAFALTFAATSASGGSFVGFPSLIYTHGWVLALWIAGYMTVPLLAMGLLGKRLNQVARTAEGITVPDVIERRFASPTAGILATLLIVVFTAYVLLAQFKAGSEILVTLLSGVPIFDTAVTWVDGATSRFSMFSDTQPDYLLCLAVFSVAVIVYVVYGGFRAVVWTDVMQGIIMFFGVLFLLVFAIRFTGGLTSATQQLALMTPPLFGNATIQLADGATAPEDLVISQGAWLRSADGELLRTAERVVLLAGRGQVESVPIIQLTTERDRQAVPESSIDLRLVAAEPVLDTYEFGQQTKGVYLYPPGPDPKKAAGYLSLTMAFSFFMFWPFGSSGQPSNMVRLMAFRNTRILRLSMVTVTIYFTFVYFSLVVIFCCARVLLPGMEAQSDRVMPEMAIHTTRLAGVPWLAGFLLAAPFAAVMSSVDSFLLMVSSSLVRDVYQRFLHPTASERLLKRVTYGGTILVGLWAMYGALHPPDYLQDIIVDATGFLASAFLAPVAFGLYWSRMTGAGAVAGMATGSLVHAVFSYDLHLRMGWVQHLAIVNPLVWALVGSVLAVVIVSRCTRPLDAELVNRFFPDQSSNSSD